mmetsp:Transcript_96062/g.140356  ORF Transcript_96062/g.140356 Transcript_96062/m.140356 type:complete len:96 (-) Transcript_96062:451-738(-)
MVLSSFFVTLFSHKNHLRFSFLEAFSFVSVGHVQEKTPRTKRRAKGSVELKSDVCRQFFILSDFNFVFSLITCFLPFLTARFSFFLSTLFDFLMR